MKRVFLALFLSILLIPFGLSQDLPSYIPTDGLVAYYPFNGNANDESGNGHHGTVNGATLTSDRDGNENSSYSFDGVDDFIRTTTILNDVKENFTFSVWVYPKEEQYLEWDEGSTVVDGPLYKQTIIHPTHGQSYNGVENEIAGAGLYVGTNGLVVVEHSDGYVRNSLILRSNLSNWNLVTIVYKENTPNLYVNGFFVKSFNSGDRTVYASLGYDITSRADYSKSGFGSGFYPRHNQNFNGVIDDIIVWNRVLSEQEIQNLYNSSTGDILLNGTVSAENHQIKNVADPTDAQDVITKSYFDSNTPIAPNKNIEQILSYGNDANGKQLKGLADPTDAQDAVTLSVLLNKIEALQDQIDALQATSGSGTVTDQDGNSYPYLTYGDQVWTVKNAAVVTYRDGTPIPQVTDATEWANLTTGAWCYYDNDPTKGMLYNWYAVAGIHDNDENTPNKELAPEGWHVPTDTEWTELIDYLIEAGYNYDGTMVDNKIAKSVASKSGWAVSTTEGTPGYNQSSNNKSGFNVYPLGTQSPNGNSINAISNSVLWSSTESDSQNSWRRILHWGTQSFLKSSAENKKNGFSVRFVKDYDESSIDNDGDGYTEPEGDCDDSDASIYPGAAEVCDGIDNDCDGEIDEGVTNPYYEDADGDGYGLSTVGPVMTCSPPAGYVSNNLDCDDSDASKYPGAVEVCDGIDNDCDPAIRATFVVVLRVCWEDLK